MKKIILSTMMFMGALAINAQSVVSMADQDFTFSTGKKECIKVAFKDVNASNLEEAFKDYFKDNYKAKVSAVKKTDAEFEVDEFKATEIQQKPTTVNAVITEIEGSAILYIHYKSDGYVVSEQNTPDIYAAYKKMTEGLANQAIAYSYTDVIEMREKELAEQQKELASFIKDNEKADANIVKMQTEIKTSEGEVSGLEKGLTSQKSIVLEKAKLVEDKKIEMATVDVKSLEKNIKDIEADSKKADKEIEKVNADIAKKNAEIAKLQSEISTLETSIDPINARKAVNAEKIAEVQKKITEFDADALKEQLKLLEKDSKDAVTEERKMIKSIEKEKGSIEKNKASIKETEISIATLKTSQEAQKATIAKTQEALKVLTTKVAKLK